ncbi:TlpA family protein disulfide reductase [Microlunatus phosphovorus]|uniref:TlpA family protein disulfide reductase n=1 Tax=Microlunatus phosphovorus TaxID=29405 RepID=UPI00059EFDF2|nr:TlpA disulfide reductase family protein [Microlunatus phosphovorus]
MPTRGVWRAAMASLVMLGIVLVAGCSATGADEPTRSANQEGYVGAERSVTIIPPEKRVAAPEIKGAVLGEDKKEISTAELTGKVVVLNVWGSWCPPCRKEAPDLQAASEKTAKVAQFIGLNTRDFDQAAPIAFNRAHDITIPSIWDPTGKALVALADTLPPTAIPSTLVIDKEGRVAARIVGPVTKTTLVDMVTDIADGK